MERMGIKMIVTTTPTVEGKRIVEYKGIVFAYDEPDHNLDFKNQVKLFEKLKDMSKDNQVIILTHSPVIMAKAGEVFDMETKQWVNSREYHARIGVL